MATFQKKAEDAVKVIVEIKEEVEKVRLALKEEEKRRIETMKALKSVRRVSCRRFTRWSVCAVMFDHVVSRFVLSRHVRGSVYVVTRCR